MNEKVTLGFGAFVPYAGGGVDWQKEDLGIPLKSYLAVVSLSPSVAYRVNEKLSLGLNLNFYRGILDVETEMEGFGPLDSRETGSAISASFGLMYRPTDRLSLGMTLRAPAKVNLSGKTSIVQQVPGFGSLKFNLDSETNFNLPWDFEAGFSYRVSENFVFSAGAQYTMWSRLDVVDKTIKDVPVIGDINEEEVLDFEDILILHGGFEYLIPGGIALRGGIGYDRSASPTETLSVRNIDVDKLSLLGGIGYKTGNTQIDFVYIYVRGKERKKTSTIFGIPLIERYNLNVDILGLGVTFSF
jgi:long-chain fatty acid transport protein